MTFFVKLVKYVLLPSGTFISNAECKDNSCRFGTALTTCFTRNPSAAREDRVGRWSDRPIIQSPLPWMNGRPPGYLSPDQWGNGSPLSEGVKATRLSSLGSSK
ncbi:hypothetical protein J6590_039747 [Homalodisca vitripennis]|nr:hypothetical protein J6590_039747 [Homalodisca vitripennis]